ncbi:MAG: hypothetical protein ACXWUG_11660 [Polyangiales bacterium]
MLAAPVRLPLQTGSSGLRRFTRGLAMFAGATGFLLTCAYTFPALFLIANAGAVVLVLAGIREIAIGLRARPSDIVVSDDGLAILGGPQAILFQPALEWRAVDAAHWNLERDENLVRLRFGAEDDAPTLALVDAAELDEIRSLESIVETVRACSGAPAQELRNESAPTVMGCATCGAPLEADDVDRVRCNNCRAENEMPADLRARIVAARAAAARDAHIAKSLAALLDQPTATATNARLVASGVPILVLWILIAGATFVAQRQSWIHWYSFFAAIAVLGLALAAFHQTAQRLFVDRQALQRLPFTFAALMPTTPGGASRCRRCGAPLLRQVDSALIRRCIYCDAENVLGFDLLTNVTAAVRDERSLEADLALRSSRRDRSGRRALLAIGALLASISVLVFAAARVMGALRLERDCRDGDTQACERVFESSDGESPSRRNMLLELACSRKVYRACTAAATAGTFDVQDKAMAKLRIECSTKDRSACTELLSACRQTHASCAEARVDACAAGLESACPR